MRYVFLTLPAAVLSIFFMVSGLGYGTDLMISGGFASRHPEAMMALAIACFGLMLVSFPTSRTNMISKRRRFLGVLLFVLGSCTFIAVASLTTGPHEQKVSARMNNAGNLM